ncbi:MAG TPA: sigma-70 family RNA polymerase sigma factor [Candidatus Binatia bacterium]|nr:sigma-70 family RNA polymerase sigma factor [Candidatus Binatia bacterium]
MDEPEFAVPASMESLAEHHERFLRFLSARVADRAAAEDILQSAYVRAMQREGGLRSQESIVAWFYRILRNGMTDHYRRNAARDAALDRLVAEGPVAYEAELKDRVCACAAELIRELKPEYREAIERVDLAEEPVEVFAEMTGITANNATVRLHRARKALATRLVKTCGICAEHKCIDCTCRHT